MRPMAFLMRKESPSTACIHSHHRAGAQGSGPAASASIAETASCALRQSLLLLQVFAQAYIPRKLEEVEDHERDYARLAAAQGAACDGIYYQVITGMKADMSGARTGPSICEVDLPAGREGHSGSEQSPSSLRSEASSSDSDSEAGTAAAAVHPATSAQRHEAQNPAQRDAGPMEREGNGDPR